MFPGEYYNKVKGKTYQIVAGIELFGNTLTGLNSA